MGAIHRFTASIAKNGIKATVEYSLKNRLLNNNFVRVLACFREVKKAFRIYCKLQIEYGGTIYWQFYKGTGDLMLSCAYINKVALENKKAIFIVDGEHSYKCASMFELGMPIVAIKKGDYIAVNQFLRYIGVNNTNVRYVHYETGGVIYFFTNMRVIGLHGISFVDMYKWYVFGNIDITIPRFKLRNSKSSIDKLFSDNGLQEGRTVILAPYNYSIDPSYNGHLDFWEALARKLNENGFTVCTNVNDYEKEIAGTKKVFIEYSDLELFAQKAGFFIGIRNGLCDLISNVVGVYKVFVYPDVFWMSKKKEGLNIAKAIDVFSLTGMCRDSCLELVLYPKEYMKIVNYIVLQVSGIDN